MLLVRTLATLETKKSYLAYRSLQGLLIFNFDFSQSSEKRFFALFIQKRINEISGELKVTSIFNIIQHKYRQLTNQAFSMTSFLHLGPSWEIAIFEAIASLQHISLVSTEFISL